MIKWNDNILRENSNFIHFKVNFHVQILRFGAKIKVGEKVRISEHSGAHCTVATENVCALSDACVWHVCTLASFPRLHLRAWRPRR